MGRHGIPQTGHRPERAARAAQSKGRWWTRWFKGDGWWLAGFLLGFCTGALLLWAGFLWWLTGDLTSFIRGLF